MEIKPFQYQLLSALPRRVLINRMCGLSVFFTLLTDEANTDYQSKCQEILPAHIMQYYIHSSQGQTLFFY